MKKSATKTAIQCPNDYVLMRRPLEPPLRLHSARLGRYKESNQATIKESQWLAKEEPIYRLPKAQDKVQIISIIIYEFSLFSN